MSDEQKKSIAHLSVDTQMIYDRLKALAVGDQLSYGVLSKLIGRDIQNGARSNLESAKRKLLMEDRIVIGTIRTVGVMRLNDAGIVGEGDRITRHIARASRKGMRTLAAVQDFDALPNDMKLKHNSRLAAMGAVALMSKGSGIRKIESAITAKNDRLALAETMELFGGK